MDVRTSVNDDTEFDAWLHFCCELEDDALKRPPVELVEEKGETDTASEVRKVHKLADKAYFKFGKLPSSAVVALHPSVSREHALLVHTRSRLASRSSGVAIMDLGSKAGTSINDRKLEHS